MLRRQQKQLMKSSKRIDGSNFLGKKQSARAQKMQSSFYKNRGGEEQMIQLDQLTPFEARVSSESKHLMDMLGDGRNVS